MLDNTSSSRSYLFSNKNKNDFNNRKNDEDTNDVKSEKKEDFSTLGRLHLYIQKIVKIVGIVIWKYVYLSRHHLMMQER